MTVRFWQKGRTVTRYFLSHSLGHTTADDLLREIMKLFEVFDSKKLLQISMDGPNVNLSLLKKLTIALDIDPTSPVPVSIGTCSLHTIHLSFKTAFQKGCDWNILKLFISAFYLFHDSPARRDDYSTVSGSTKMPLKCCVTRWAENRQVAARFPEIWPNIVEYVKWAKTKPKSSQPQSDSYKVICTAVDDAFILCKVNFFLFVANVVEPFLKYFQAHEKPMAILMPEHLEKMLRTLCRHFVKPSVLDAAHNSFDLVNIDLSEPKNLILAKEVEIGFATRDFLFALRFSLS